MKISKSIFLLLIVAFALPSVAEPLDLSKRRSLSPQEAASLEQEVIFLDVRTSAEWEAGHIKGAIHIPHRSAGKEIASLIPDRSVPIVAYCTGGGRASYVVDALQKQGYTVVPITRGGYLQLIGYGMEKE